MNFLNNSETENDYINNSYNYFEENEYFSPTKDINDDHFFPNENGGSQICDDYNLMNEREEKINNDIHPFIEENIFDEKYKKIYLPPYIKKNSTDSNSSSIENKNTSGSSKLLSKKTKRIKEDKKDIKPKEEKKEIKLLTVSFLFFLSNKANSPKVSPFFNIFFYFLFMK